jgi:RNA polymerase sigma-70 factor (ECF subfamily)
MAESFDRERFEAVFRAHYGDVFRFLARRTDLASAEDLANETFTVYWRRPEAVPDDALPWLYGVARRTLANHRRSAARAGTKIARARAETPPAPGRDPADCLPEQDTVRRALAGLTERDRETLRLVAWEGLSLADAARVAGVNRAAFAARLQRAKRRLAARLEENEDPPLSQPRPVETTS